MIGLSTIVGLSNDLKQHHLVVIQINTSTYAANHEHDWYQSRIAHSFVSFDRIENLNFQTLAKWCHLAETSKVVSFSRDKVIWFWNLQPPQPIKAYHVIDFIKIILRFAYKISMRKFC